MVLSFLHLEDTKPASSLFELEIDGHVIKDQESILSQIHQFYSCLYSASTSKSASNIKQFLSSIPSLPMVVQNVDHLLQPV